MSASRSSTIVTMLCFASLCPVRGGEEANFEKSALSSHNRRLLGEMEEYFSCFCFEIYDPVCGTDGNTYSNSCYAGCAGAAVECSGECPCKSAPAPSSCVCTEEYDPVCGKDGTTYSNSCYAGCAGAAVECSGECPCKSAPAPTPCICPAVILPVCGKDGKTYQNACAAACVDVQVACEGECPCKKQK